jgi:predicted KAP-like P-loop ATPase
MEIVVNEDHRPRLLPDVPITRIEQDKLGRAQYAEHLAKIIQNNSFTESAVIGICGEWGTGKTSLMNLVECHLKKKSDPHLHIVHFKPWRWSDERWLNTRFFDAIVKQAGIKDKDVRKLITTFVDMLCELDKRLLIAKFLLMLVPGFKRSSGDSIEQVKEQLGLKLVSLKTKIVVVLDDIDRLTPQEALEVMKLVKCNADFPNILYIMLYQRDILTKYLEEAGFREQAEFYLEKIEQVHFSVPQAGRQQLESILNENLDEIIQSDTQLQNSLDERSWAELLFYGFYDYFKTIRDVNRYTSSLAFHTNLFHGEEEFEVNLADLMALEVFRVFKPSIYQYLHLNRDILTGTWAHDYLDEEKKAEMEWRLSSFLGEVEKADSESNTIQTRFGAPVMEKRDRAMVRFLRPDLILSEVRKQLNAGVHRHTSPPKDEWYRNKRLCHPDMFDRYFRMAVQDDDISHSDMKRFQQSLFHEQDFDRVRADFEKAGKFEVAMTRIRYFLESQKPSASQIGLFNLCRLADDMPVEPRYVLALSLFQRTSAYMIWVLTEISPDIKGREAYLLAALQQTKSVAAISRVLHYEWGKREAREEFKGDRLLDDEGYEILKKAWLEMVSDLSLEDPTKLLRTPALSTILWVWYLLSDGKGISKWVSCLRFDSDTRRMVLRAFKTYSTEGERINTKDIEMFFGPAFESSVFSGDWDDMDPETRYLHEMFNESRIYYLKHAAPDDLQGVKNRSSTENDE